MNKLKIIGEQAKQAQFYYAKTNIQEKDRILDTIAKNLQNNVKNIIGENKKDLEQSKQYKLSPSMQERLELNEQRILEISQTIRELIELESPLNKIHDEFTNRDGLKIQKISVPLGTIGIIYESRPNVTIDAACICLKSGNITILRGGKEARHTNEILVKIMQESAQECGFNPYFVQLLPQERSVLDEFVRSTDYLDLLIPRGGEGLIEYVNNNARIPVIKHYKGVCHLYIAESADDEQALNIVENAKCQRPSVCNALEALIIHRNKAKDFLPKLAKKLSDVELRASKEALTIYSKNFVPASKEDWGKEYNDKILFVHIIDSTDDAINFINHYGSHHSDGIISSNKEEINQFLQLVDSAAVYANASTRFTDGNVFGMGAEIGISTDKIHARGPMGLNELTIYKFIIHGNGHIRN